MSIRDLKKKLIERALESPTSSRFITDAAEIANAVEILTRVEVMEIEHGIVDVDPAEKLVRDLVKSELGKKDIPF
jgi:hypothetical protein